MNHILVLYDSKTGNTAKMARLVGEGAASIADTEVRLRSVDEAKPEDLFWCDGLALGSPTNMGLLSWKMKRFWDDVMGEHWMKLERIESGSLFEHRGRRLLEVQRKQRPLQTRRQR